MTKKFSQDLFDKNDFAKELVVNYLKSRDYDAWVNPDKYGIDVYAEKDENFFEIEVEVKHNWKGQKFPYEAVHFSERKRKFIKPSKLNIFWMLVKATSLVMCGKGKPATAVACLGMSSRSEERPRYFANPVAPEDLQLSTRGN